MIKRLVVLVIVAILGVCYVWQPSKASALSASDWRAGSIIDDNIFTNSGAMSVADIQNFLNQKVGTTQANGTPGVCDTNGVKPSELGGGTRAQWGAAHGAPAPFTCLKDYYEVPKTTPGPGMPANNYGGVAKPVGAISAAQIIYNAAQQHSISPRVLLTVLQKESVGPLVTDDWPTASQYTHPMGAHCPDTSSCDPNYYGFSMQMYESARLFRSYLDGMDQPWWGCTNGSGVKIQCANNGQSGGSPGGGYKVPFATNFIRWHPNVSCGGANIYISTKATAALYMYTPYQPNAAALNNMNGTGDSCSSYGNRNFWRLYTSWFGSTSGNFAWWPAGYTVYDRTGVTKVDPNQLQPGETYVVSLAAVNVGGPTWTNNGPNPVTLATADLQSHKSSYCNKTWVACDRPAYLTEATVSTGETGHFRFKLQVPYTLGSYSESFKPVAEFLTWFGDVPSLQTFKFRVVSPGTYSWNVGGYQVLDQSDTPVDPTKLQPGQPYVAVLDAINTGTATWRNNGSTPVTLATANPQSHSSPLCNKTWVACDRPAYLTEASVAPGQTGHFRFAFRAPYALGSYRESFKPVAEFFAWFNDVSAEQLTIQVVSPGTYSWTSTGYIVKDQSNQQVDPSHLTRGQVYTATLTATNTGTATWTNNGPTPVTLAPTNPQSHNSFLCHSSWLTCNRAVYLTEASVAPGQTGHFTFTFKAPSTTGSYTEYFKPVAEFIAWFNEYPSKQSLAIQVTQ